MTTTPHTPMIAKSSIERPAKFIILLFGTLAWSSFWSVTSRLLDDSSAAFDIDGFAGSGSEDWYGASMVAFTLAFG